jgi:hypothetical protein
VSSGYRGMTPDEFVDYLIDECGLAVFVDEQLRGLPERDDSHWLEVTQRIWHLSGKQWQPTPAYVQGLYDAQCARKADEAKAA